MFEKELKDLLNELTLKETGKKDYDLAIGDFEALKEKVLKKFERANYKEKIQEDGEVFTEEGFQEYLKKHHGAVIEKIKPGNNSGFLTFLKGLTFPMKGFPDKKSTKAVGLMKRIIPFAFEVMYNRLKPVIPEDPNEYSKSVRELYRVFSLLIKRESNETMKRKWQEMRDIICIILEKDLAYRLRMQDVLSEINLDEIRLDEGDKQFANENESYKWGYKN